MYFEEETELADGVKIGKVDHTHTTALGPALLGDIHTLKLAGDNRCWLTIKRIMESHSYTTIIVPSKNGIVYRLRKPGIPEFEQNEIYKHFNITDMNKLPHTKVRIMVERQATL